MDAFVHNWCPVTVTYTTTKACSCSSDIFAVEDTHDASREDSTGMQEIDRSGDPAVSDLLLNPMPSSVAMNVSVRITLIQRRKDMPLCGRREAESLEEGKPMLRRVVKIRSRSTALA